MRNHKLTAVILFICMMVIMSGCQLAKKESKSEKTNDQLIGVYITKESLHQDRLYARLIADDEDINAEREYVFEGVKGIRFFTALYHMPDPNDNYLSTSKDDVVSECKSESNYNEGGVTSTLEGKIYVVLAGEQQIFYMNPVYQSSDGSVYAEPTTGVALSSFMTEGANCSQNFNQTITTTENGETKTLNSMINVSISAMFSPKRIIVLQMDQNSNIISKQEYDPGMLPETITVEEETEYIIVETWKQNGVNEQTTSREIYDRDDEVIETFHSNTDQICEIQYTKLLWSK